MLLQGRHKGLSKRLVVRMRSCPVTRLGKNGLKLCLILIDRLIILRVQQLRQFLVVVFKFPNEAFERVDLVLQQFNLSVAVAALFKQLLDLVRILLDRLVLGLGLCLLVLQEGLHLADGFRLLLDR